MAFEPSPLEVVETHFVHVAPTHLTLHGGQVHPWLQDRTYSLYELREVLMSEDTPYEVRDGVWRHTIRAARRSQDWMVGALGLCMPALRSIARRACRGLTPGGVDAVESAILAEAVRQVRTVNTDYARLVWYLIRPVHRTALSARKHEKDAPFPIGEPGREEIPDPGVQGSPDVLLVAAMQVGVLSRAEAILIARTRLENLPLTRVAQELGVSYKACAKRRERAEARLVAAVHAGEITIADALLRQECLLGCEPGRLSLVLNVRTHPKSMSHRPFPLAS
ncbi:sigma-70 family RNA polymerase sigma factor [Nocardiopsis sp. NPDC049922]|uniref:sigma-70 family RNA polymerase sigma factor n=1 Tax=Nocardiopsis sp. NPDC049922 TaxID=3155157 RepID=UPI003406DAA4